MAASEPGVCAPSDWSIELLDTALRETDDECATIAEDGC